MVSKFWKFIGASEGAASVVIALSLPAGVATLGLSLDYTALTGARSRAIMLAEGAALAAGREMTLGGMTQERVQTLVTNYVTANLADDAVLLKGVKGELITEGHRIKADVALAVNYPVGLLASFIQVDEVTGSATAKVGQQQKLCALSLSEVQLKNGLVATVSSKVIPLQGKAGLDLQRGARLTANGCLVHSNLDTSNAIRIGSGAVFKGDVLCAVGNVQNLGGTVNGDMISNCPKLPDPLAQRPYPNLNAPCLEAGNKRYESGSYTLKPGTYCGDVTITGTAQVRLMPGSYIFKRRLQVDKNAELRGAETGLFFSGKYSYFRFNDNALIDLSAPSSGEMAGILIWEGMDIGAPDEKVVSGDYHQVNSDRARRLTGTIYLPAGHLLIDSKRPVADASEFTVLVASRVTIGDGPNLVLNTNYAGTSVPVPKGLGPLGAKDVRLTSPGG